MKEWSPTATGGESGPKRSMLLLLCLLVTASAYSSGTPEVFASPRGMAVDAKGRIYVVEGWGAVDRIDDMKGTNFTAVRGTSDGRDRLNQPSGIALDSRQRIYVADSGNRRIVRFDDMSGRNWTVREGEALGVAIDSMDRIYILSDCCITRIRDLEDSQEEKLNFAAMFAESHSPEGSLMGLALDNDGRIYVAYSPRNCVVRMDDMQGTNMRTLRALGGGITSFNHPEGIAVDSWGHIYVADSDNSRIVRMDNIEGANWITFGRYHEGDGKGEFQHPSGIVVDATGRIYVTDRANGHSKIVRFADMDGRSWESFGYYLPTTRTQE